MVEGHFYDSKAIAGVAHGLEHPEDGPLARTAFTGGEAVQKKLEALGFEVRIIRRADLPEDFREGVPPRRNPAWLRDELILALDLYVRHGQLGATSPEVSELSEVLNRLPLHPLHPDPETFRNPNGVALKLANFAALDPAYPGAGMSRGGRLDAQVWDEFTDRKAELSRVATAIREEVDLQSAFPLPPEEAEDEAPEGGLLFRRHRQRERNPGLVRRKKQQVLQEKGRLNCEICLFDFKATYGIRGEGFIEAHHVLPLSETGERMTRLKDLALVCSNCHRMLHYGKPRPTVNELIASIRENLPRGI